MTDHVPPKRVEALANSAEIIVDTQSRPAQRQAAR